MEKENVVKDVEKIKIIGEKKYQQFKKNMCKTDDYFTIEEWKKLAEKISVILA